MSASVPFLHVVPPVEDTDERMSEYSGDEHRTGPPERRQRTRDEDRRFYFDVFKWVLATLAAVFAIYVATERRAATSDLSATYLDRKADEIKQQMREQSRDMNTRLDTLAQSVAEMKGATSGLQSDIKSIQDQIRDLKQDYKTADDMLKAEQITLRSQLADVKAKVK